MPSQAQEETEIRQALHELVQALRAKDIEALMAHYAPGVIVFDLRPPHRIASADAYRRNFDAWFATVDGPIDYQTHELVITVTDNIAFCHSLSHVRSRRISGDDADYWVRVTSGLQKMGGRWMIIHEHISMPTDLQTMQARQDLQP